MEKDLFNLLEKKGLRVMQYSRSMEETCRMGWKQHSQYIDPELEKEIRELLKESLIEFYWFSSVQMVSFKL